MAESAVNTASFRRKKHQNFTTYAKPKGHPVRAAYPLPVTVLGQNRLADVRAGKVAVKHLINDIGNIGKNVSAVDKFVVKGGGRSNGKIIAFVPVPLRIHPVQGKGHNR